MWVVFQLVFRTHRARGYALGPCDGDSRISRGHRWKILFEPIPGGALLWRHDRAWNVTGSIEHDVVEDHALVDVDINSISLLLSWRGRKSLVDRAYWCLIVLIAWFLSSVLRRLFLPRGPLFVIYDFRRCGVEL